MRTEYVEVCAAVNVRCRECVCVSVLNISRMDLDFVGVHVYLSV